jgi:hypothetical protein
MDPIWAFFVDFDEPPTGKRENATIQPETRKLALNASLRVLLQSLDGALRGLVSGQSRSKNIELHG